MFCRTPDDAFQAGWAAAKGSPALTPSQIDRLVLLHRPYLVPEEPEAPVDREAS